MKTPVIGKQINERLTSFRLSEAEELEFNLESLDYCCEVAHRYCLGE